jgi:hypothetical protein
VASVDNQFNSVIIPNEVEPAIYRMSRTLPLEGGHNDDEAVLVITSRQRQVGELAEMRLRYGRAIAEQQQRFEASGLIVFLYGYTDDQHLA